MNEHPSVDILETLGTSLKGKVIVLALTGSVGCAEAPALARLLMRHGAQVYPVMTREAARLVGPDLMEWSTGHKPILELTGQIEHVDFVGNVPNHADLLLVAPATANTIGKAACGIDDTPVTTFITTAIGQGIPLIVVPAMHLSMYNHPLVKKNLDTLRSLGIQVLMPRREEGKAKIATKEEILEVVQRTLVGPKPLEGLNFLITAGRTVEYLDPIRVLTNNSTGKMGMALALSARDLGAKVTLIYGKGTEEAPLGVETQRVETAEEMMAAVANALSQNTYQVFIAAAAVGDWKPAHKEPRKITTHGTEKLILELIPTPKILDRVRDLQSSMYICAFRAQHGFSDQELEIDALQRLKKARANLIAVNDTAHPGAGFGTDTNKMTLWTAEGQRVELPLDSKKNIALKIVEFIRERL